MLRYWFLNIIYKKSGVIADSRAKARKIPDKPVTSYCVKKKESAQRKMGDVKRTEKLVIKRLPLAALSL